LRGTQGMDRRIRRWLAGLLASQLAVASTFSILGEPLEESMSTTEAIEGSGVFNYYFEDEGNNNDLDYGAVGTETESDISLDREEESGQIPLDLVETESIDSDLSFTEPDGFDQQIMEDYEPATATEEDNCVEVVREDSSEEEDILTAASISNSNEDMAFIMDAFSADPEEVAVMYGDVIYSDTFSEGNYDRIKYLVFSGSQIDSYAMYKLTNLEEVIINGDRYEGSCSPIYIGEGAFSGLEKLRKITFHACTSIEIGKGAFSGDVSLKSISINTENAYIDEHAFRHCGGT